MHTGTPPLKISKTPKKFSKIIYKKKHILKKIFKNEIKMCRTTEKLVLFYILKPDIDLVSNYKNTNFSFLNKY